MPSPSFTRGPFRSSVPAGLIVMLVLACEPAAPPEPSPTPWDAPPELEAEILGVVQAVFDVIERRDTELGSRILRPGGRFVSVRETGDGTVVQEQTVEEFLESIAREGPDFLERFWDPVVLVRGDVAVVWTPYDFFVERERSHCGVDAFTLVRSDGAWRVETIVYTVEVTGCDDPPLASPLAPPAREAR